MINMIIDDFKVPIIKKGVSSKKLMAFTVYL